MFTNVENQGSEHKPAVSLRVMSLVRPRFLWLLICLILAAGLAASASAQIVESREWLVKKTEHRTLDEFGAIFGWPDPELPKGQAVLYVEVTGRSYRVLAVGPITSDAKQYAEKLVAWRDRYGLSGTVQYSQEDDCAAADFSQSVMGLGKTELSYTIPLASLYRELQLEDTTRFGMIVTGGARLPQDFPQPDRTKPLGYRYWNLSELKKLRDAQIVVRLDWWSLSLFAGLALFPLVCVGAVYFRARSIARSSHLPLGKRREMFVRTEAAGKSWTIVAVFVLAIAALLTQAFASLNDLWFSLDYPAYLIFLGFSIVFASMIPFVLKSERNRLLQACLNELTDREPGVQFIEHPKPTVVRNTILTAVKAIIWVAAIAIAFVPTTKADAIHDYKIRIALFIFMMSSFIPDKKYIPPEPTVIQDQEELSHKAKELIAKVELIEPSLIKEFEISANTGASINVSLSDGKLTVSEAALRRLSLEELEFCVLEKHWTVWISEPPVVTTLGSASALILWLVSLPQLRWVPGPLYIAIAVILVSPFLYYLGRLVKEVIKVRKKRFNTDLRVVQATGNRSAAISALQKQDEFLRIDLVNYGHNPKPTYSERIARIRAAFPETSSAPAAE